MPSRGCLSTPRIVKTRGVFRTISPGTMPPHERLNFWKPWWEARQTYSRAMYLAAKSENLGKITSHSNDVMTH